MSRQYSIAEARRNLPTVVDHAAAGAEVELTRRGKPVAVVISVEEYQRLKANRTSFGEAFQKFREAFPAGEQDFGPKYFDGLRDRDEGRRVDL
jgi:prevent-host-death family protein